MRPFDFPQRATEGAAGVLAGSGTNRRDFLVRVAAFGAAFAVRPVQTLLRPEEAYAHTCSAGCASGYSAFCCTLTGSNSCPSGTAPAGWWRANVSTKICSGGNRFYLDCVGNCPGDCSGCKCANDPPTRRVCCNHGYTQCRPELTGHLRCRIVRCESPCFIFRPFCPCTGGIDPATACHGANCVPTKC